MAKLLCLSALLSLFALSGFVQTPLVAAAPANSSSNALRFSTQVRPENQAFRQRQEFVTAICARMQWQCQLKSYPPKRVEAMLQQGLIDVEIGRAEIFHTIVPSAVRVPTPITEARFAILSLANNHAANQAKSWHDLKPLRVAYIRGYKFIEKHQEITQLHPVDRYDSCLGLLLAKRSDVCLISIERVAELLAEERQDKQDFYIHEFTSEPLYLYLSKQRANLLPKFDGALREMRANGSLKKIFHR